MWNIFKKKGVKGVRGSEGGTPAVVPAPQPPIIQPPIVASAPTVARLAPTVFLRPLVSEKTSRAGAVGTYVFAVQSGANKITVAKAFAELYKVKPVSVRLMIVPAKRKRTGRIFGTRPAWKKALVRVPKGTKVDIFTGV